MSLPTHGLAAGTEMAELRTDGAEIAAKARELLKVPFRPYGRTRTGIDCIGVPMYVAFELGIWPRFKLPKYSFPPQPELFEEIFPQYADEVTVDEIAEGDIIIFRNERGDPQHVAIAAKSKRDDDVLRLVGVTLSPSRMRVDEFNLSDNLKERIYKVWRYRNVPA